MKSRLRKFKERQRYALCFYYYPQKITKEQLWKSISYQFTHLFGTMTAAKTGLYLIDHNEDTKTFIIRISHYFVEHLRTTLCSITQYNNNPLTIHVLKTSGTIKSIKRSETELNDTIKQLNILFYDIDSNNP